MLIRQQILTQNRKNKFASVEMSSDVDDDQVLPESLQKLEIVPVFSHSQSACKANEHNNPFFSELSEANRIDDRVRVKLQHQKIETRTHISKKKYS